MHPLMPLMQGLGNTEKIFYIYLKANNVPAKLKFEGRISKQILLKAKPNWLEKMIRFFSVLKDMQKGIQYFIYLSTDTECYEV